MEDRALDLAGIFPPIPTPFDPQGELAVEALRANFAHWNRSALRGYVLLGSNGEAVHLTEDEKLRLLEAARAEIPEDRLFIAGTGCQSTRATIALTRKAAALGADAALVLTPSYYRGRMTAAALRAHYDRIADASSIPIILYNMPACTGIDLTAETVVSLAEHPNVIGIKDSGGNLVKFGEILHRSEASFQLLAGSADFLLPALALGAVGGVLALANIAPDLCLQIYESAQEGDWDDARATQLRIIPLNGAVTRRWGVAALKAAMDRIGLCGGSTREPLLPLDRDTLDALRAILTATGIETVDSEGATR